MKLGSLSLSGPNTLIAATASQSQPSGQIDIQSRDINIAQGASITVEADHSDSGKLSMVASNRLELHGDSAITANAAGNGGAINLRAKEFFYLDHSQITAAAGGNGGNISIDPVFLVLNHGLISANAERGVGGDIRLVADNFFRSETQITATGTTSGTIRITAPDLDLSNALTAFDSRFIDSTANFQERCSMNLGGNVSTFLVVGRGGVTDSPGEPIVILAPRKSPSKPQSREDLE